MKLNDNKNKNIAYCNSAKQVWISTVLVHVISSIAYPVTNQIAMLSSSFAELGPAQPQLVFLHFSTQNSTFYLSSAFPLKSKVVYLDKKVQEIFLKLTLLA